MRFESGRNPLTATVILLALLSFATGGCTALVIGGGGGSSYPPAGKSESAQDADEKISAAVRAELEADRSLAGTVIRVSTLAGVVTLEGSVASYSERSQAEALAAGIQGVRGIDNRIKVDRGI